MFRTTEESLKRIVDLAPDAIPASNARAARGRKRFLIRVEACRRMLAP